MQGEDVAARGHMLLFSVDRNPDNLQTLVTFGSLHFTYLLSTLLHLFLPQQTQPISRFEAFSFSPFQILRNAVSCVMIFYPSQVPEVYSKELKGAISALASLQGHLKGAISALASLQSLLLIASGPKISWF